MLTEVTVNVGEGLKVALWVARWRACGALGSGAKITLASTEELNGSIKVLYLQSIRLALVPFKPALFAIDPDV